MDKLQVRMNSFYFMVTPSLQASTAINTTIPTTNASNNPATFFF